MSNISVTGILKTGFGKCQRRQVNMTYSEGLAAAAYVSEYHHSIGQGQTVMICDVDGDTTDPCILETQAEGELVVFPKLTVSKSLAI